MKKPKGGPLPRWSALPLMGLCLWGAAAWLRRAPGGAAGRVLFYLTGAALGAAFLVIRELTRPP